MYNKKEVGERLKQFRNAIGLTQTKMSEQLQVPQSTYSKYELGKLDINMDALGIIQNLHKVNLNWLLIGSGGMLDDAVKQQQTAIANGNGNVQIQTLEGCKDALHAKELEISKLQTELIESQKMIINLQKNK